MGDVEFSLHGSNDPTTIRVAMASQPREGGIDGHCTETAQAGPVPGGQGTVTTPTYPGMQLQLGEPAQTATGPTGPYSGFEEALKRWGPSGDTTAARDLKWQRDVIGDTQKIKTIPGGSWRPPRFLDLPVNEARQCFCDSPTFTNEVC